MPAAITAKPTKPVSSRLAYSIIACDSSGGDGAAVALGPVRAAEARAGQPHGGAGEHDQRERGEGDRGDLRVACGEISRRFAVARIVRDDERRRPPARPRLRAGLFLPPAFSTRYWTRL